MSIQNGPTLRTTAVRKVQTVGMVETQSRTHGRTQAVSRSNWSTVALAGHRRLAVRRRRYSGRVLLLLLLIRRGCQRMPGMRNKGT